MRVFQFRNIIKFNEAIVLGLTAFPGKLQDGGPLPTCSGP